MFFDRLHRHALSLIAASGLVLALGAPALAEEDPAASGAELSGKNLTTKQKKDFATATTEGIDGAVRKLLKAIEEAQKRNDVILLNCLNEKLGLLRGAQKAASDAEFELSQAVALENEDLVEHNFHRLHLAREQGDGIAALAEACRGQVGSSFPGQTRVVVNVEGGDSADNGYGLASETSTRTRDSSPTD